MPLKRRILVKRSVVLVSTALLLNEVSEKGREIWNEVSETLPEICSEICPEILSEISVLSWQVEKSSPKTSLDFPIRDFKFPNRIPNQIFLKYHKHTSAGLQPGRLSDMP